MALDNDKAMSSAKDAAVVPQAPLLSASPRVPASPSPSPGHSDTNNSANSATTTSTTSTAHQSSPTSFTSQKATPHGGSSRKRVFTFQKRWLHSLPIMEKTLPEPIDGGAMVIKKSALRGAHVNGASTATATASATTDGTSSSSPSSPSGESARDVIVCMLCDEQNSNHHLMKIWSRVNCRRGRIENHLMSKHPEFMLLLKHKRDSEGELAVQIFLQGMREGRCNIRSEINLGLYNHIQSLNAQTAHASMDLASEASVAAMTGMGLTAIDAAHHNELLQLHNQTNNKRGFPSANVYAIREGLMGGTKQLPVGATRATLELLELENRHKRVKLMAASEATTEVSAFVTASPDATTKAATFGSLQTTPAAGHTLDSSMFSQWHPVFVNKLVVITGGENECITAVATHLWLLGANVLLTFTDIAALDAFTTSHVTRFPDVVDNGSADPPRGVMLSMLCSFQTRKQIDEWSQSIADKFTRVDFLINFVHDIDVSSTNSSADKETGSTKNLRPQEGADAPNAAKEAEDNTSLGENGSVSDANQLRELCRSIYAACFQSAGSGSVLNITIQSDKTHRDLSCTAVEVMTKSLALELQPSNVQLNSILVLLLQPLHSNNAPNAQFHLAVQQDEQQHAALLHSILFLLSPMSSSVSGSILRLQCRAKGDSMHAPASVGINAPSPPTAVAESGVTATSAENSVTLSSGNAATAVSRPATNHIV
uniref:Uncharacterized protein n=1 Tax=Globisporangium ultimum (strain ATCC 200006 / CBS 805.95 / DAOM BR144) TaxID=431595 RepID=K3W6B5_GLOUD